MQIYDATKYRIMRIIDNRSLKRGMLFLSFFFFTLSPLEAQMRLDFNSNSPIHKLQMAEMAVSNLYVDSVDENKLVEDAIRGMLEKLDPHSLTPRQRKPRK